MSTENELGPDIAAILGAAGIPPERVGANRGRLLSDPDRGLYRWIVRRFVSDGRPSGQEIAEASTRLGVDLDDALAAFAREDLVHVDEGGEITVAYPFSGRETAHRVRFATGTEAYAMCALDALGIAPMLDEPIEVVSRDPLTGTVIRLTLQADGAGDWRPRETVVVAGAAAGECGPSYCACCPVLNFFASSANARRWLERHPDVRGEIVSISEAIAAGRAVFGDVLQEPAEARTRRRPHTAGLRSHR